MEIETNNLIEKSLNHLSETFNEYKNQIRFSQIIKSNLSVEASATLNLCKYLYYNCEVDEESKFINLFNKAEMLYSKIEAWRIETSICKFSINTYLFSLN